MQKLFAKKPDSEKRSIRYPILLTEKEASAIRESAEIRNLSVAEFMRRAALGRKADIQYYTGIVLELGKITEEIRRIHAENLKMGINSPDNEMKLAIQKATLTILKISEEH